MFRFLYVILANVRRGPYIILLMRRMIKNPDKYSEKVKYNFVKKLVDYLKSSGNIETKVYGKEYLPKEGGYVMFPNHQGKYDALGIIYAHDEPCTFVMDRKKSNGFLVKEMVDVLGAKRMDTANVRQAFGIINEITEEVKQGKRYILFSEGGYFHNRNTVKDFKPGSFKCAVKAKAPIVPVALIDSYMAFNSRRLGHITTKVIFLPPLYYDDYRDMNTQDIANTVRSRIICKMKEFGIDAEPVHPQLN